MQKIIIDTNVLVSALIQRGYPFQIIIELFSRNDIELCISDEILKLTDFKKAPAGRKTIAMWRSPSGKNVVIIALKGRYS